MNPRIRIVVILGVLMSVSLGYYLYSTSRDHSLVMIGTVDANEVIVSSKITGRIEKLMVAEGDAVQAGELIAVIDSGELTAEKSASEAQVKAYLAQLSSLQATAASTTGDTASAVANARAALAAARASLAEATADRDKQSLDTKRTVALAAQGIMSAQDRDRDVQSLNASEAHVRMAQQQVTAAEAQLRQAEARTAQASAARSNVAAQQSQAAAARAQLEESVARLGYTRIYAPVSGRVSLWAAREGEVVNPASAIVTIVDLKQTWVYVPLPENYADAVQLGDTLEVHMPSGAAIPGKVIAKAAEADFATQRDVSRRKRDIRTIQLKLLIDNPGERYVPGMTAEVRLPQEKLARR
jgi:multidrug resistance efflux pump